MFPVKAQGSWGWVATSVVCDAKPRARAEQQARFIPPRRVTVTSLAFTLQHDPASMSPAHKTTRLNRTDTP
jgi:hypothetical protein